MSLIHAVSQGAKEMPIQSDENGYLKISATAVRTSGLITYDSTATALGGQIIDGQSTETIDALNFRAFNIYVSTYSYNYDSLIAEASHNGTVWLKLEELYSQSIGGDYFRMYSNTNALTFRYYRLINKSGNTFVFSSIAYGLLK
jgi:hypothetical protein